MRKTIITLVCVLAMAAMANAANVDYMVTINGSDVATINPGDIPVDTWVEAKAYVNVPDSDLGGGAYGGLLQYAFNFSDTGSALTFEENVSGFPAAPDGTWKSASVSPLINMKGILGGFGYDVYDQCGYITPSDHGTYYAAFGAGPGVWSEVCSGNLKWSGGATDMVLVPQPLTGHLVFADLGGGAYGAENPTGTSGDTVEFVPEPMTMTLLAVGGLALIRRRKA